MRASKFKSRNRYSIFVNDGVELSKCYYDLPKEKKKRGVKAIIMRKKGCKGIRNK